MGGNLKILLIPLDNRPVSYSLPRQITSLNKNTEIFTPPKELLGGLNHNSDIDKILSFTEETLNTREIDYIVVALDTIACGGLIPSRRSRDTFTEITDRINKFKNIIEAGKTNAKIFGFTSIMRISDSYENEEEKIYWEKFGREIFRYSYLKSSTTARPSLTDAEKIELAELKKIIPSEILDDYLKTREKNFSINRFYIKLTEEGFFDFLVFGKDDSGKFGLNVTEAEMLEAEIKDKNLSEKAFVLTGTDEIPSCLALRAIIDNFGRKIKIFPVYSTENGRNIISRYEDKTISECTAGKIKLCGGELSTYPEKADMFLLIHTPVKIQNDHCLNIHVEPENKNAADYCVDFIKNADKPVIIGDVACANGADNLLVMQILARVPELSKIYAYAGWNTTGNTLGSAISAGISRFVAENSGNGFDMNNFKKFMLIRLSEDWAYQTIVRQKVRAIASFPDTITLKEELVPLVLNIAKKLDYELSLDDLKICFPWNRTFEAGIDV